MWVVDGWVCVEVWLYVLCRYKGGLLACMHTCTQVASQYRSSVQQYIHIIVIFTMSPRGHKTH